MPPINIGGAYMESGFAAMDFAEKLLDEQRHAGEEEKKRRQKLLDSGNVSALDLDAPREAIVEFNRAEEFLKNEKTEQAVIHFQKALRSYPKFVSAHHNLGIAYHDLGERELANNELGIAVQLDPKFAPPYVTLSNFELSQKDFSDAEGNLQKAAALRPYSRCWLMPRTLTTSIGMCSTPPRAFMPCSTRDLQTSTMSRRRRPSR